MRATSLSLHVIRIVVVGLALAALGSSVPAAAALLSFEERVEAQRALERVYWAHRIWPKENPGPKPSLGAVMDDAALRARVEDYLKKSNALEAYWGRPITAEQLQAEIDRMASRTRDGQMLRELFAALNDDPFLIAECLARPVLADRLLRSYHAQDDRFQGAVKALVANVLATLPSAGDMNRLGGEYLEQTWRLDNGESKDGGTTADGGIALDSITWRELVDDLAARFGASDHPSVELLPVNQVSTVREDEAGYSIMAILDRDPGYVRVATTRWQKPGFDDWWSVEQLGLSAIVPSTDATYTTSAPRSLDCTDDTWLSMGGAPDGRRYASAVWTGTEMIVFGGASQDTVLSNGGYRYNPATDTWTLTSAINAPRPRSKHTAVWTGSKMIVWGGVGNTGGVYDPATDTWSPTSTGANVPSARSEHTAVWTGSEMIVWGGLGSTTLFTGARYNPVSDTWTSVADSIVNVPSPRTLHTAVWTGSEMIVWGGFSSGAHFADGGRYNPVTNTWLPTSVVNNPPGRSKHTAVWTGSEMIVWGGGAQNDTNTGGRYTPTTDSWTLTSTGTNVPSARSEHVAVWTGSEMIVWGATINFSTGSNTGGRYNPSTNTWLPTSTGANVPSGRANPVAVWTGTEMIVWGGYDGGLYPRTGGRYNPNTNSWVPTGLGGAIPEPQRFPVVTWTGTEMLVWGNIQFVTSPGGRYSPALDTWTAMTTVGAPSARQFAPAVWTGLEMIVWGGGLFTNTNTGGRYNPVSNTWKSVSTGANVPSSRTRHTAVWTGSEMIAWGGNPTTNTGGRYNPSTNTWLPTSTGANVPSARTNHVAAWTGTEMIVWSGSTGGSATTNSGGRYSPSTDSWLPTGLGANLPDPRCNAQAVWTGSKMMVWGGQVGPPDGGNPGMNTGGIYDPVADSWTAISTSTNVPSPRFYHGMVWTGTQLIVWGGYNNADSFNDGGRYDPTTTSWTTTSVGAQVPFGRHGPGAVRTASEMIVWGGTPATSSGGRYCAQPCTPQVWYEDTDGDGYGKNAVTQSACAQPAGYVSVLGDCDDSVATIHPDGTEVCNLADDDCDAVTDEGFNMDGDAYTSCGGDCNDNAATTYPGAPQLCDGINNNCSDPGWPTPPANEANADNDGFRICAGDCDDTNATVRPGAPQLCDGINNNCSDPGWPTPPANEANADGDAFRICQGDCNDANPAIYPGATEVCNGINDDCDAFTDEDALGEDSDGDGVKNLCDNCVLASNASQLDTDMDGDGNACDNCVAIANPDQADPDMDSRGTVCDNCPIDSNPTQDDTDTDLVGDACDNCLLDWNTGQGDVDSDFEGDVCDFDDGLIYEFRTGEDYIEWQAETGPTLWNVYEGDLDVLRSSGVYTQPPGPLADQHCGVLDVFVEDFDVPPLGKAVFTLVTGEGSLESLGQDSHGLERDNDNPCP
jgi:N-acetylneuraminic acid mutarotase